MSDRAQVRGARMGMGNPGTWSGELVAALHRTVFLGPSGGTPGQVDAFVVAGVPMGYENLAPLPVIVGEAGGHVTDLAGEPVLTGDGTILASNGVLHELLALVAGLPRARDWRALVSLDQGDH